MKKILITGSKSRAASRFSEFFSQRENAKKIVLLTPGRRELDIADQHSVHQYFSQYTPDFIIHFAAITDLKDCENSRGDKNSLVWKTNVLGTQYLVEECNAYHLPILYISTSLVFSGLPQHPGPYDEKTPPEANQDLLSWYGVTKSEAERIIRTSYAPHFILRFSSTTRAQYIERRPDFLWKIVQNLRTHRQIPYFSDQQMSLTDLTELGDVVEKIMDKQKSDIFHLSSPDITTPAEVAQYLTERLGYPKNTVQTSTLASYAEHRPPEETRRFFPQYSGLRSQYTQDALGLRFKTWREIVDAYIQENRLENLGSGIGSNKL